ncbi:MAG: hypothetical protein VXW32_16070 [Myxococcota bacterium]|nr:hypothetical protein [Myxococcota bacterium]
MGFSGLLLGVLHAAEPSAVWTPGVGQLGHEGLVSGEFDGHLGLDWAASYRQGETSGIAFQLSGSEQDWFLSTQEDLTGMRLKTGNWDSDPEDEVLVGLPHYGSGGAAGVLDLGDLQELPEDWESAMAYWVESSEDAAQLGADLLLVDCVEGGNPELIVSAPQSRMNGTVYAFSSESSASPVANWTVKWEGSHRFGYALHGVQGSSNTSELLVASCDYDPDQQQSCASDGRLWRVSAATCDSPVSLDEGGAELSGLQPTPFALQSLITDSAVGSSVLWSAPELKSALDLEERQVLFSVETSGDLGDVLQTQSEGLVESWLASSGKVWKVPGPLAQAVVEDSAHRNFETSAQDPLGLRLADAGDWESDGCADVLASSGAGESLWLLSGCESEQPDTGEPVDTGTGPDTGSPADSGEVEDTGEPPCEAEFGWRCAVSSPRWKPGFWGLAVGLFCLNRRRKTD